MRPKLAGSEVFFLLCSALLAWTLAAPANTHTDAKDDVQVCFNNCSGHGDCHDFTCSCWPGYHGDDCSTSFVEEEEEIVPILTAGHFNLTKKNLTHIRSHELLVVGFSSYACHKCIRTENEYKSLAETLAHMNVPFGRINFDNARTFAAEVDVSELPAIVVFTKGVHHLYSGVHRHEAIVGYIQKIKSSPFKTLNTKEEVLSFVSSQDAPDKGLTSSMVLGFFTDHDGIEEDEYDEFVDASKELHKKENIFFGAVVDPLLVLSFKNEQWIDATPSVVVVGQKSAGRKTLNLREFYGESISLASWIIRNSVPLAGFLTPSNFDMYAKIGLPMLIMFLNLSGTQVTLESRKILSGKSGGILNEHLVEEFSEAAKDHVGRITFVYADGVTLEDHMRGLGIYGGRERLPQLAFNTKDGRKIPFPEMMPINRDTILQFCANFLSGKLNDAADAKEAAAKALLSSQPINKKNTAVRKERKKPPKEVKGISEQYTHADHIITVDKDNFTDIVMDESKDIVLMLHSVDCEPCSHFAVYYKRVALRFYDMQIRTLIIARMDVTDDAPPSEKNMLIGQLPLVLLLPAHEKRPPYIYYSGVGKVQPIMRWVHEHAYHKFDLPNLPHLSEKDRELYKEQVREREEHMASQRSEAEALDHAKDEL